jgi:hypothetical protein
MTSKDSDIRHRDSPASSTNYTSERRLDKAGEGERERIVVGGGEWPAIYKGFNFHVINTNPKSMRHLMVYTHLMIVNSFTSLPLLCILSVNHNPFFIEWIF